MPKHRKKRRPTDVSFSWAKNAIITNQRKSLQIIEIEIFVINVWFKKHLFNTNYTKIVVHPSKLIYTDDKKKETHWEFDYEKGIDI